MADDQNEKNTGRPKMSKWAFAFLLLLFAAFMFVSIGIKIIYKGP